MSAPFTPEALTDGLGTHVIGKRVICLERTSSTNDRAWAEAAHRARDGTVVFAEEQTRGRGRLGRTWHSPRGAGVWMSVVLRPEMPIDRYPILTSVGAVATAAAIAETIPVSPRVRWPNDVVIGGRKVAGVLAEVRDLTARRPPAVLGIGVNVNLSRDELPKELRPFATSLAIEAGGLVNRLRFARALLLQLDHFYRQVIEGDVEGFNERWQAFLDLVGERVRVRTGGRWHVGRLVDIDPVAGIFLRSDAGPPHRYLAEHVEMLRPFDAHA